MVHMSTLWSFNHEKGELAKEMLLRCQIQHYNCSECIILQIALEHTIVECKKHLLAKQNSNRYD